ncbi:DUF3017 domain-containing protein [Corynebacterium nuruki]|nr:DUF3017 domain-containing protein [Corynebacterium nuruki]
MATTAKHAAGHTGSSGSSGGSGSSDHADRVPLTPAERRRMLDNPHDVDVRPSGWPQWFQMLIVVVFLVAVAAGVVSIFAEHWRRGIVSLGAGMVWLGMARWVVDSRIMGVLAVRSRKFDSAFCIIVGGLLLLISLQVDALGS